MFSPGNYWMASPVLGTAESQNGTPYIYIEGDITHVRSGTTDDGQAVWDGVLKPERRTVFMYLSDKAFQYTVDKLEALGWNGDFKAPAISSDYSAGIEVECGSEMYKKDANSVAQPKEKWNLPGGGGLAHKAASIDKIRQINAMYKNRKAASGKKPTPAGVGTPGGGPNDGIPFDQQ